MRQGKTTRENFSEALDLLHDICRYTTMLEEAIDDLDNATESNFDKLDNYVDMILGCIYDTMDEYVNGKKEETKSNELPF